MVELDVWLRFDSCNNLLSSVHTIFVIILQYAGLNIKTKILLIVNSTFLKSSSEAKLRSSAYS